MTHYVHFVELQSSVIQSIPNLGMAKIHLYVVRALGNER